MNADLKETIETETVEMMRPLSRVEMMKVYNGMVSRRNACDNEVKREYYEVALETIENLIDGAE